MREPIEPDLMSIPTGLPLDRHGVYRHADDNLRGQHGSIDVREQRLCLERSHVRRHACGVLHEEQ
jgi:hypothetical protein